MKAKYLLAALLTLTIQTGALAVTADSTLRPDGAGLPEQGEEQDYYYAEDGEGAVVVYNAQAGQSTDTDSDEADVMVFDEE